nr:hypothetical protein [Tanacetum cinerariifolium]
MVPHIKKFETEDDVAVALANYIYHLSAKFIARHGSFSVVLSGGTFIDTMRKLTEPPYIGSIHCKVPIPKGNIYPIKEGLSPEETADAYEHRLKHLVANKTLRTSHATGFAKFDLISAPEIAMVVTGEDAADAVKVALGKHANDGYPFACAKSFA